MLLSKVKLEVAIKRAPSIESVLRKLADKVMRGIKLPATISIRRLDYAAQGELERLLGTMGNRMADGRLLISISPILNDPTKWSDAFLYFNLSPKKVKVGDVFERLKLLVPGVFNQVVQVLQSKDEIVRFAQRPENSRDWLTLAQNVIKRKVKDNLNITTLSQLGSDWFGDSKKLRAGPWRRQLVLILAVISDCWADDERTILEGAFIQDNPYTSHVTFSAPVVLHLKDKRVFDYPVSYYHSGMAVQLPLETVSEIDYLEWVGGEKKIFSTENAAPFVVLIEGRSPSVYTAGYPNLSTKIMLSKFSDCGCVCEHEGDADLDGFRIASEVGRCIELSKVVASEVLSSVKDDVGIPLTPDQEQRMRVHLTSPQWQSFIFNEQIHTLLKRSRWIEQESFGRLLSDENRRAD